MKKLIEVLIVTAVLVAVTRLLYVLQYVSFVGSYYSTIFAVIFLYVPLSIMWHKKTPIDFLDNTAAKYLRSFFIFLVTSLIIFPLFFIGAHFWETLVFKSPGFNAAAFPDVFKVSIFQLLLIALPEEFFYRGYMQGTLNTVFAKRWRIWGTSLGWAWPLTALIFAFSHSFVQFRWWHFSIFFPGLLFGWLREKTGSITAPILFHAACNIISDWIARCYF